MKYKVTVFDVNDYSMGDSQWEETFEANSKKEVYLRVKRRGLECSVPTLVE